MEDGRSSGVLFILAPQNYFFSSAASAAFIF